MTSKLDTAGLVERAVEAMRDNPFTDDAGLIGTTQQDMRMEHYARVAIESLTQAAAPDMELQRFTPKTTIAGRDALPIFMGMEPDPDGAWVHYTEARAALAHKGEGRS